MKVLIWIGCIFVATILNTLLGYATGFKIGYLIFYLGVYFVAKKLCDKWDEHKSKNKDSTLDNKTFIGAASKSDIKVCFCRKCGERLIDNSKFCRKCGTEVIRADNTQQFKG